MVLWGALATSLAQPSSPPSRVAVVVGSRGAPPSRGSLQYAHDDAARVAQALEDVGGFSRESIEILYDPRPEQLLDALAGLPAAELVLFYYSGHADPGVLYPGGSPLSLRQVRDALEKNPSTLRIGILDACRGGAWTGAKGVRKAESFPVDTVWPKGVALIAASSGADLAHEGETYRGSIFTTHWVAGIRGLADIDNDGVVTLSESFAFARDWTVRDSTALLGEVQRPSFRVEVVGRQPIALADLREADGVLELEWGLGTVQLVTVVDGVAVATLRSRRRPYRLVLPAGPYLVRREWDGLVETAAVDVESGRALRLSESDFVPATSSRAKRSFRPERDPMIPGRYQSELQMVVSKNTSDGPLVRPRDPDYVYRHRRLGGILLSVGVSDRLSWTLTLGPRLGTLLGLRVGSHDGPVQATIHGGIAGVGLSHEVYDGPRRVPEPRVPNAVTLSSPVRASYVDGQALLTVRGRIGRGWTWHGSSLARGDSRTYLGAFAVEGAAAVRVLVGSRLALSLGGGVDYGAFDPHLGPMLRYSIGSGVLQGARHVPLVQVHLTRSVALEGFYELDWLPDHDRSNWVVRLGVLFLGGRRRPEASP